MFIDGHDGRKTTVGRALRLSDEERDSIASLRGVLRRHDRFGFTSKGPDGNPTEATLLRDTVECMSAGIRVGSTDAHGDIAATFAPELVTELKLFDDGRDYEQGDELTEGELRQLFATGRLSLAWPRVR